MLTNCRLQYDKLEADLQQASTAASRLAQENCELKSLGGAPVDSALGGADPLAAQQVAKQMEALLQEKSKLAQENDRLLRENSGLQVGGWQGIGVGEQEGGITSARQSSSSADVWAVLSACRNCWSSPCSTMHSWLGTTSSLVMTKGRRRARWCCHHRWTSRRRPARQERTKVPGFRQGLPRSPRCRPAPDCLLPLPLMLRVWPYQPWPHPLSHGHAVALCWARRAACRMPPGT